MPIQIKPKQPLHRGQGGLLATGRPLIDLKEADQVKASPHYENLSKTLDRASESTINEGKMWYRAANLFATSLSQRFGVTVEQAAGVIACLSPAAKWERNLLDAENLIKAYYHRGYIGAKPVIVTTYGNQKEKALGVLTGKHSLTPQTGRKTFNFMHNIIDPSDPDYVTVDRHAWRVLVNDPNSGAVQLNPRQYSLAELVYKTLARQVNLVPCELQAIAWTQYKKENGNS